MKRGAADPELRLPSRGHAPAVHEVDRRRLSEVRSAAGRRWTTTRSSSGLPAPARRSTPSSTCAFRRRLSSPVRPGRTHTPPRAFACRSRPRPSCACSSSFFGGVGRLHGLHGHQLQRPRLRRRRRRHRPVDAGRRPLPGRDRADHRSPDRRARRADGADRRQPRDLDGRRDECAMSSRGRGRHLPGGAGTRVGSLPPNSRETGAEKVSLIGATGFARTLDPGDTSTTGRSD